MRMWFSAGCLFLAAGILSAQPAPSTAKSSRPELTLEQAKTRAAELRTAYGKPAAEWPKPTLDPGTEHRELGLLPEVIHPKDNPHSKDKEELGRALFFDGRLSGTRQSACASCHDPDLAWADGRTTSFGHDRKPLKRNAPTVANTAFATAYFWDGRSASLEAQAKAVLANPDEMRADEKELTGRLEKAPGYTELFEKVFGDKGITVDRAAMAIACFERTVVGGRSRFDTFLKGKPEILSDSEVRGLHLFRTDARCLHCHNGPTLSDGKFHDVGLSYYGREFEDLGRFRVTKAKADVGAFRTPSLRNVGKTSPYMHNGLFDLDGVLRMYNAGMPTLKKTEKHKDDPNFPTKSPLLKPLGLNKQDLADLEAFLRCLDEPARRVRPPAISLPVSEIEK
ncbi:cytochrome-c peroxidase [Zavarzinella formosa]|uniref:cytochrome-c peroxidase n=1 Tax=Zavarzinella formosa TaxID=360055 RepID=UPI0002F58956|nr:cytochrome c peroxidase [Zavarzinella formosa]